MTLPSPRRGPARILSHLDLPHTLPINMFSVCCVWFDPGHRFSYDLCESLLIIERAKCSCDWFITTAAVPVKNDTGWYVSSFCEHSPLAHDKESPGTRVTGNKFRLFLRYLAHTVSLGSYVEWKYYYYRGSAMRLVMGLGFTLRVKNEEEGSPALSLLILSYLP